MKWKTREPWIIAAVGVVVIGALILVLTGCSTGRSYDRDDGSRYLDSETINVDGRDVTCIIAQSGISCDW